MPSDDEDEVTREPFEVDKPPENRNSCCESDGDVAGNLLNRSKKVDEVKPGITKNGSNQDNNTNNVRTDKRKINRNTNKLPQPAKHICTNDTSAKYSHESPSSPASSSCSDSSFEEDQKFAQTFGIVLKGFKHSKSSDQVDKQEQSVLQGTSKVVKPIQSSVTSDCLYHRGCFYQKGDIIAVRDADDKQVYFAQITGFLQDQFCEKSASLNWLVPIKPTRRDIFEPAAYKIGYEDSRLRKLDCMTFVRHCPFDYYSKDKDSIHNSNTTTTIEQSYYNESMLKENSYIWTTMSPCKVPPM